MHGGVGSVGIGLHGWGCTLRCAQLLDTTDPVVG
jgi:hypothetical protein